MHGTIGDGSRLLQPLEHRNQVAMAGWRLDWRRAISPFPQTIWAKKYDYTACCWGRKHARAVKFGESSLFRLVGRDLVGRVEQGELLEEGSCGSISARLPVHLASLAGLRGAASIGYEAFLSGCR